MDSFVKYLSVFAESAFYCRSKYIDKASTSTKKLLIGTQDIYNWVACQVAFKLSNVIVFQLFVIFLFVNTSLNVKPKCAFPGIRFLYSFWVICFSNSPSGMHWKKNKFCISIIFHQCISFDEEWRSYGETAERRVPNCVGLRSPLRWGRYWVVFSCQ